MTILLPARIKDGPLKKPIIRGAKVHVPLTRGYFAIVDICDLPLVRGRNWSATQDRFGTVYAKTGVTLDGGKRKVLGMHRIVCGVTDPTILVDHKDGNGLNNCRDNLRLCTETENRWNRGLESTSTTGFKGVSLKKETNSYEAKIRFHHTRYCLGSYRTAPEAAMAYDMAAIVAFGEFATLNFPNDRAATRTIHPAQGCKRSVPIRITDFDAVADHFKDTQIVKAVTRILAQKMATAGIHIPGVEVTEERKVV